MNASQDLAPADLKLNVRRGHDGARRLTYSLSSPSGRYRFLPERVESPPLEAPDRFKAFLVERIESLRENLDEDGNLLSRRDALHEIELFGGLLAERLFPPALAAIWREIPAGESLLIISDEPWIPWELVKPPEAGFLAMRFHLTRWLPDGEPTHAPPPPSRLRILSAAVVAAARVPCLSVLENAEREVAALRSLGEEASFAVEVRSDAKRAEVHALLQRGGRELLHVIAHGETTSQADGSCLYLNDLPLRSRHLLDEEIRGVLRRDRPLVVLSACEVGRLGLSLTGLGGWPESWIASCHASGLLAPLWRVDDLRAAKLVESFYRNLYAGQSLGEALRGARLAGRKQDPGELSWLAWSLYGHPNAQVVYGARRPFVEVGRQPMATPQFLRIAATDPEPLLDLPAPDWDPALSAPGALLRAEYRVVPFHFRDNELAELEAWCRADGGIRVHLCVGPGGIGKTRLMLELCRRMRTAGWLAGEVRSEDDGDPKDLWQRLEARGGPRLLLIDYAETRRALVAPLLRWMRHGDAKGEAVRVLLVARAAGDWWDLLKMEDRHVEEFLSGPATSSQRLTPLALSAEDRHASYTRAVEAFARTLGQPRPETSEEFDFSKETFERALLLHMSALAAVQGMKVQDEQTILDFVLSRERRFWREMAKERSLPDGVQAWIGRAMAVITLAGGAEDESGAVESISRLRSLHDQKESVLRQIARLLSDLYPGRRWITPLQPDLLGEHLVQREMERGADELLEIVLSTANGGTAGAG